MKKLLVIGALCFILLGSPAVSLAQTLTISQLQAIVASLQAQLNALIAQLNLIQQQENNSKCLGLNQEGGAGSPSCCSGLTRQNLSSSGTTYKCVKPIVKPIESIKRSVAVVSPNGGETWTLGSTQKIKWRYSNSLNINNRSVDILLEPCALPTINDRICNPDGYSLIASLPITRGEVSWTVGSLAYGSSVKPGLYLIRICVKDDENKTCDASDRYLKITDTTTSQPSITVVSPNGGETLKVGSNHYVQWSNTVPLCGDCAEPSVLVKIIGKAYEAKLGFIDVNDKGFNWKVGESMAGTIPLDGNPFQIETCVGLNNQNICDRSDYFTITGQETPSRAATINVKVLKGGIYCIKAPCEFPLAGAEVSLYNSSKVLVGTKVVDTTGTASFSVAPGTYTAYAKAAGYSDKSGTVGVVVGQTATLPLLLNLVALPQASVNPDLASVLQSLQGVLQGLSGSLSH